jgi:hypothetical protein
MKGLDRIESLRVGQGCKVRIRTRKHKWKAEEEKMKTLLLPIFIRIASPSISVLPHIQSEHQKEKKIDWSQMQDIQHLYQSFVYINSGWDLAEWLERPTYMQCRSRKCPGILRQSGIWGAADEAVLNKVLKKNKKSPLKKESSDHSYKVPFHLKKNLVPWAITVWRKNTLVKAF